MLIVGTLQLDFFFPVCKSFWVDNQARQDVDKDKDQFEAEVPIYNREFTLGSSSADGSSGFEGYKIFPLLYKCLVKRS